MSHVHFSIDPEAIMKHVRYLAEDIGPRLAGSENEQKGADYIEAQMKAIGLQNVEQQHFNCRWYDVNTARMDAKFGEEWQSVTMDAVAHSPSTDGVLEAELVYVETAKPEILERLDLKGKVALVHGTYGANSSQLKMLAEKEIAAVIWTDVRYTPPWNLLVGLPFTFQHLLTFPAASVPHPVEWELVRQGVDRVRLELDTVVETRTSQNVVGELPGKNSHGGVLISGHHDSVRGCSGAEDNAAGVGVALAIADAMKDVDLEKGIKFVSFGTEEQLSQGSFAFVDEEKNNATDTELVLNVDGQGCWAGENEIFVTGSAELHEYMRAQMDAHQWSGVIYDEPDGFSDHFPFIAKGVPAGWFHRRNCAGGRWFHHSIYDTVDALSPQVLASCAGLVAGIAHDVCTNGELPFEREFSDETRAAVKAVADGWLNP